MSSESAADVVIYSWKRGEKIVPPVRYLWDCSSLRDPMGRKEFRSLDGREEPVKVFLKGDPFVASLVEEAALAALSHRQKLSWYVRMGFVDAHGKWGSVGIAELVGERLKELGGKVFVKHLTLGE